MDLTALAEAFARGEGELLSDTRRACVRRLSDPTGDVVVKEIRPRRGLPGLRERLRRVVGRTRGQAADHAAARLRSRGLPVPEPLGLLEREGRSLLFSRWVSGRPLSALEPARWTALATAVAALVGRLHAAGAIHGDLQPKNVLVDGEALALIDLDRVRFVVPDARARARDLAPLLAGAEARGLDAETRARAWAAYLQAAVVADSDRLRAAVRRRTARYRVG